MTEREALKLALEFITASNQRSEFWLVPSSNLNKTVTAIREVLGQPEQEPVAMVSSYYGGQCVILPTNPAMLFNSGTAFYTSPPYEATPLASQRSVKPWVGLSTDEIYDMYNEPRSDAEMVDFARAIEAKLKEKNA